MEITMENGETVNAVVWHMHSMPRGLYIKLEFLSTSQVEGACTWGSEYIFFEVLDKRK